MLTVMVAVVPMLHFAYRAPALHTAVGTTAVLALLLATSLVSHPRRQAYLNQLLLVAAFAFLTLASVLFGLGPALPSGGSRDLVTWDGRIGNVLGALLFAAAALTPKRRLPQPRRAALYALVGAFAITLLITLPVWLAGGRMSAGVWVTAPAHSPDWPDLHANKLLLALHLFAAVMFGLAAVGFLRRSSRRGDEFLGWLAVAAVLAGFSQLNYALYPTRFTDWCYVGDGFRLLSYLVLLAGALREISLYWRSQRELAVLEERRRIAHDLHDGLAQEIAYLGRNLNALAPTDAGQAEQLERLQHAAERAHLESQLVLATLVTPVNEPLEVALGRATTEIADRFGVGLQLELAPGLQLPSLRAEALVRIACEAVTNAARHSGSHQISLSLEGVDGGVRLAVRDRGCGFDATAVSSGFGLVSMRERAEAVGGSFVVESVPGCGTVVGVVL